MTDEIDEQFPKNESFPCEVSVTKNELCARKAYCFRSTKKKMLYTLKSGP